MMVKVPPPRGKGEPPRADSTIGNLDKPDTEDLVSLNFRVPKQFRRAFKIYAAEYGRTQVELIVEAFEALKRSRTQPRNPEHVNKGLRSLQKIKVVTLRIGILCPPWKIPCH
jgi:hypothetical protein